MVIQQLFVFGQHGVAHVRELNNYMDYYADWQDETGAQIIAVSIDDSRSMSRVAPFVMSSGWEYEVLLDPGRDLQELCK